MKKVSLLTQILAINALLVAGAVVVTSVAVDLKLSPQSGSRETLVLLLALLGTLLANAFLLRRRLEPLERLITTMERVDLAAPGLRAGASQRDSEEVERLRVAFNRMLERLEAERHAAARAVLRAQEQERGRIAQDLHDEVNQALTAILLRVEATRQTAPTALGGELREIKRLTQQAMDELLHLAHELRPSALDDLGLMPALHSQVRGFTETTRVDAAFRRRGTMPALSSEQQLVIYRVTQESLSNVAQHADARHVLVELSFVGRTVLRIADDGRGMDEAPRNGGFGLSGMRERALLVGGRLSIHSAPDSGTTVTLTME